MENVLPTRRDIHILNIGLWLLMLWFTVWQPVRAETITIGKGTGIVWEGLPFSASLSGPLDSSILYPSYGLLTITNTTSACTSAVRFRKIAGYTVYPLAPGIGLVPRSMATASYYTKDMQPVTISATIGLPETQGLGEHSHITSHPGYEWCISPGRTDNSNFYSPSAPRTADISGTWVIVADGTQKAMEVYPYPLYAGSFGYPASGKKYTAIFPANTTLRISTLECTVNTPTQINFGPVPHDPIPNAELGSLSYPLTTQCSQNSDRINANINLQFRAISGLYQNSPTQLSLTAGGGYITGELDSGATGSGSCTVASGIPFDNQAIRIGSITSTESSRTLTNLVTWRLCSGGPNLPLGNVDAAAEMSVTFN